MVSPADITVRHFSTFPHGGAAMAAQRLHFGLGNFGLSSRFMYHRDEAPEERSAIENLHQLSFNKRAHLKTDEGHPLDWLPFRVARMKEKQVHRLYRRHLTDRPPGFETYGMARLPYPTPFSFPLGVSKNQIIHLHWISFFLDYPSFFESIPDHTPIVWTLHDTNAFTGGCHFVSGCERFQSGCGSCPQIQRPGPKDVSRDSFLAKQTALKNKNVHVVSPSNWLMEMAKQSSIWPENTQFSKIHYGMDLKTFRPLDREATRQALGLPADKQLVAFGAADLMNERKGIHFLAEAMAQVEQAFPGQVECLIFGEGDPEFLSQLPSVHSMGFVKDAKRLNQIYSAADMVVVPSLEDNQPQTGLESMACGTPVVAFDAGGIPEFVRHEQTGLLARPSDATDLATQISRLVGDSDLQQRLGQAAREMMVMEFEIQTQAWQHLKLYRDILSPTAATKPDNVRESHHHQRRAA